jgi:hypothetical protein
MPVVKIDDVNLCIFVFFIPWSVFFGLSCASDLDDISSWTDQEFCEFRWGVSAEFMFALWFVDSCWWSSQQIMANMSMLMLLLFWSYLLNSSLMAAFHSESCFFISAQKYELQSNVLSQYHVSMAKLLCKCVNIRWVFSVGEIRPRMAAGS